jgi:hypothetical protein
MVRLARRSLALRQKRADGLVVYNSPLFNSRRVQLATLAVRYAMPTVLAVADHVIE